MTYDLTIRLPDWHVPDSVRALSTCRNGGVSIGDFKSFNLAHHVGDDAESVKQNRAILVRDWLLPTEPHWLNQTHSTHVIEITDKTLEHDADASWTEQPEKVCAVMTADCLPLLVYNPVEHRVAAIHAGWRGLLNGVIENTLDAMTTNPAASFVWLGPAIGPSVFEVGPEVVEAFTALDSAAEICFTRSENQGKFLADIYALARQRLQKFDITNITGGNSCTYLEENRYFSYRRDNRTGRMASLVWLNE